MKLLTTEQLAEIDNHHEALTQHYANADKERGYHKGKYGAENQSHHDRGALRGHIKALEAESASLMLAIDNGQEWSEATITTLEAEITELHNDVGFYRCCALSGEIPDDSVSPSALLKQEQSK